MRFDSRVFKLAKDTEHPEQNEDVCRADAARGIAAIADGVASGIFSRQWARILAEATVADPPDPEDEESFRDWLAQRREAWSAEIDVSQLAWHQKPKLREGAFSTLLWVRIDPLDEHDRQPQDPWRLRAMAVGDSCLFHVREDRLLRAFPVQAIEEFEIDPIVLGSVDLNRDDLVRFKSLDVWCRPGDWLALCTDAVAERMLRLHEAGQSPAWQSYWRMTEQAWQEETVALRNQGEMRYDDATLLLLRVSDGLTPASADAQTAMPSQQAPVPTGLPRPAESGPHPEWTDRLRSLSGRLADEVSVQVARGVQKLKEVRRSAESAIRKYRDRLRSEDKTPPAED